MDKTHPWKKIQIPFSSKQRGGGDSTQGDGAQGDSTHNENGGFWKDVVEIFPVRRIARQLHPSLSVVERKPAIVLLCSC